LTQAEDWLYKDGARAAKSAYASKLQELKNIGDPIVKRYNEFTSIPEAVANFINTIKGYENILLSNDANLAHIT
jgi:heat shock protein 4